MPSNPQIYPADFPSTLPGIGTGPSPIDVVVSDLNATTRRTGIRRANERRILGYAAIANQNSRVSILNDFLPLLEVGTTVSTSAFNGTKGLVAGYMSIGKLTYSSQTYTALSSNLSMARSGLMGVGENTRGYYCGGLNVLNQVVARVDRMVYSSEVCAAIATGMPSTRMRAGAVNSAFAGYMAGGDNSVSAFNSIAKIVFATESNSLLGSTLSESRWGVAGVSNVTNGYFSGGAFMGGNPAHSTRIERFAFSGETNTVLGTTLSLSRRVHAGRGNTVAGYYFGGVSSGDTEVSRIDKLTYAGETNAVIAATLTSTRRALATTPSSTDVYLHEGTTAANTISLRVIDRFVYASESCSRLGRDSLYARWFPAGLADFSVSVS